LDNLTQLIRAQKIAAWKEVAQRVAHEIKNPLTPIQLSAERIIKNIQKGDHPYPEAIEEGARTIVQEALLIKSMVDEFSNFARMPKVQPQAADIREIVEQAVSLFRGIFTDIEFEVLFSADIPPSVSMDPEQMKRAIINILDNAIDAMNKQGKITVNTFLDQQNRRLHVEITDSGPGITAEEKSKLFLPHFSTKKKGSGLGLAIVNQIIREHNGTVDVVNNRPQGAKFIIQIPS
ncbi:MAG TPA: ATP-binding protein, partial [Candidatus Aminicenantes bacterium]|nr:ATP-binding protein [Candidatus Aminicenantes bacterium]